MDARPGGPMERMRAVVLAAGKGKRMSSDLPKVVHPVCGQPLLAYVLEAGLVLAFSMLLFGKFCLGAYVFHVLRGETRFANSTLPWAR